MYFESALYFIGLGIKFIENAYFIIGCYWDHIPLKIPYTLRNFLS